MPYLAILVRQHLNLEMARVAGKLHHKDGRPRDLGGHLLEEGRKLVRRLSAADPFATTAFGRLDHHRETNALGRCQARLFTGSDGATPQGGLRAWQFSHPVCVTTSAASECRGCRAARVPRRQRRTRGRKCPWARRQ